MVKMMVHDRILAIGLYEDGFPLNRFYCELFWILMDRKMPRVCERIRRTNVAD